MYYWKQEIIIGQGSIMVLVESCYKSTLLRAMQIKILTQFFKVSLEGCDKNKGHLFELLQYLLAITAVVCVAGAGIFRAKRRNIEDVRELWGERREGLLPHLAAPFARSRSK